MYFQNETLFFGECITMVLQKGKVWNIFIYHIVYLNQNYSRMVYKFAL